MSNLLHALDPNPHATLSCDGEAGQQQDESNGKHWKVADMGSSSQSPHCHPSGVVPYHQRRGAERTTVADSGWKASAKVMFWPRDN